MKNFYLVFLFFFIAGSARADKVVTVSCTPSQATIYRVDPDKEVPIGTGSAVLKIDKDVPIKIIVRLDGYMPVSKTYVNAKSVDLPKEDMLVLDTRVVKINAQPYDAHVFINGVDQGKNVVMAEIKKDVAVTVDVKKVGFATKTKMYQNRQGTEAPPVEELITLAERSMMVKTSSPDIQIIVDGKKIGEGNAEVIIPQQSCVTVQYVKEGFVPIEKQYCAKEGQPIPPVTENIALRERQIAVRTTPQDATIRVSGLVMASGEYKVRVLPDQCVEVIVEKAGFVISKKFYCNKEGYDIPISEHIILPIDEAFTSSIQSDQANVNFTIETSKPEEDAWKVLSQITMGYFDNIELADKETGYLRTAWNLKLFGANTIRTRIIVKQADISPLKYSIKLVSESSGKPKTSVKDDEQFSSWDRILNTYKDVISEYQSRLK